MLQFLWTKLTMRSRKEKGDEKCVKKTNEPNEDSNKQDS